SLIDRSISPNSGPVKAQRSTDTSALARSSVPEQSSSRRRSFRPIACRPMRNCSVSSPRSGGASTKPWIRMLERLMSLPSRLVALDVREDRILLLEARHRQRPGDARAKMSERIWAARRRWIVAFEIDDLDHQGTDRPVRLLLDHAEIIQLEPGGLYRIAELQP